MEIIKDDRKKQLFRILKNLYYLAEKDNWDKYLYLKEVYNNLLREIYGHNWKHGEEGWEWDNVRNALDSIYTLKSVFKGEIYIEKKLKQLVESLKRIENLKRFLI